MEFDMSLTLFANATAGEVMRAYVTPAAVTLIAIAALACTFFLVYGGIQYMSSFGNPEKLNYAKKIIKNALIGLVLVIAAGTLTAILSHAYSSAGPAPTEKLPTLQPIEPANTSNSLTDVLINAIVGLLRNIVQSIGEPFLGALAYFINSTPLMAENASVFNLWLAIVGITDVLFILVVGLLGFHVMSFEALGLDEIEIKHLLPQLAFVFLLINTSIFAIDAVISLSNAMIYALKSGFPSTDIWATLAAITKKSSDLGVAGLLVMIAFLVLAVMLLVYYIVRLITLYLGAILSPIILLLWLLPAFKDFVLVALKTYLTTIFVLFVHVVILLLAASIFTGMLDGNNTNQPNTLMALMVGLATILALLKTQGFMQELSYAASVPRASREMASTFIKGASYTWKTAKLPYDATKKIQGFKKSFGRWQENRQKNKENKEAKKQIAAFEARNPQPVKTTTVTKPLKTGETRKANKEK